MLILHKLLPLFLSPLVVVMLLTSAGLMFKKPRLSWAGLVVLVLASLPVTSDALWRAVEMQAVRHSADAVPAADSIVVLGGIARTVKMAAVNNGVGYTREWMDSVDRFTAGLELFRAGRAPRLIFTGGQLPWGLMPNTEGDWLREQAMIQGIPSQAISVTSPVQDTAQEARAVAQMQPAGRVILVTSAFHMPRARALFEAQGLQVQPFPVDFRVAERAMTVMDWLPDSSALDRSDTAVRELLGRLYYAMRWW